MSGKRAERLEGLGMVWDAADAAFEENIAAARLYFAQQWLSNVRRPGALADPQAGHGPGCDRPGLEPALADRGAAPLRRGVRELLVEETVLTELLPGVTVHRMDVGKWLERSVNTRCGRT